MFKKITKYIFIVLLMVIAIPVFSKELVSLEKITGKTDNEEVVLNATDSIDLSFNDLNQKATYKVKLKNNTDEILYVNNVVTEDLSEAFINFSLSEKSLNAKLEPGKTKEVEVIAKTLDITHAGRNVNDEISLKFLLGDKIINPATNTNWIVYIILGIVMLIAFSIMSKNIDKKKNTAILMICILCGTIVVSANDADYYELKGKVTYTSQNLMQESGTTVKDYSADYTNSSDVWKYAEKVKNIIISDNKSTPEKFKEEFDLTTNNSKRIMGYLVENKDSNVPYDLYIVSRGVMYAPANATGLFSFPNVETIKGLEFVEFDNTTNMTGLFLGNSKLKTLDVKEINTANVTNASYMFNGCDKLEINEKDLDLSKVTDKTHMYATKLTDVVKVGAKSDEGINFSKISSDTNGKGLYYTNKNTQDNKTTYYFRGAVDNNYVKFGTEKTCSYKGNEVIYLNGIEDGVPSLDIHPSEEKCLSTTAICDVGNFIKDTYGDDYRYVIGDEQMAQALGGNQVVCGMFGGTVINEKATYDRVDVYWKIVRINEEGSTRLIYQGNYPTIGRGEATIGESAFNEISNDNAHVGYMFGKTGSTTYEETHKNTNDSTIKKILDKWYEKNLKSYSKYIADAGFCNDRSITAAGPGNTKLGYGTNSTNYKAWEKMYTYKPQFACPQKNDLFTVNNVTGNKSLTYPIGLITIDEVSYAGGVGWPTSGEKPDNEDFYLNNGTWYWTMTPNDYSDFSSYEPYERYTSGHWYVASTGYLYGDWSKTTTGDVRPVINIKSDVVITGGNGTATNPYVVKTN